MEAKGQVPERVTTTSSGAGAHERPETTKGGQRHAPTHASWTGGRSLEAELEYQSTLASLALIDEPEPVVVGHQRRYAIRRLIGRGAMGAVYFAEDSVLGARAVAIKVVSSQLASRLQLQDRLRREAWALALLNHPNVLTVHDVDHAVSGELFIVMEYVDGPNLREWVAHARPSRAELLAVFTAAGRGLAAAHEKGLVHRDVKPDNVLLHTDGQGKRRVLVADFGLAGGAVLRPRAAGEPVDSASAVSTHVSFMGTPAYASPEQRRGQRVDARSDQYAFCVSLWEMLVGERPDPESRARPPELPPWLYRLLRRGLAQRVDERWPDMATLLDALEHTPGRRRRLAAVGGALVLGAALVGAGALLGGRESEAPAVSSVDPCAELEAELDELWSPARRRALEAHLRGLELPYANALAADALATLDAAVASRRERSVEGCARGERLLCHERWGRRFARRVDLLARLDADDADHVHELLAPLRDDALCDLYSASLDAGVQELLDAAEEREALGEQARARELAEEAWSRAGQLDSCTEAGSHSPEAAAAAYRLGHIHGENHAGEAALGWLDEAVRHAIACEDDSMLLAARLRRAKTFAVDVLAVDAAARDLDEAQAYIDRFGAVPAALELERALSAALIELQEGKHAEAERRFDALLGELEGRPLLASEVLINKGVAAQALGRLDAARRAFTRARELAVRAYGRPPEADIALLNLGIATREAGEEELASELLAEAATSSQPGVRLRATTALVELSYHPEDPGRARALAPKLLELVRAHPEQAPDDRAYALVWAGQILADAGERDGLEALREAVEIFAEHMPEDEQRDRVELSLAWNYHELDERELARHHYEEVLARDPAEPVRALVDELGSLLH